MDLLKRRKNNSKVRMESRKIQQIAPLKVLVGKAKAKGIVSF